MYIDKKHVGWFIISAVLWIIIIVKNDFTHFTWWSIASFAVYANCAALDIEQYVYWMFLSIQLNVIAGVLVMSFFNCDLLHDALGYVGTANYILGNFIMHYVPFLVAVGFIPADKLAHVKGDAMGSILAGYGVFTIYNSYFDATKVYGCSFDDRYVVAGSSFLTLLLILESKYNYLKL